MKLSLLFKDGVIDANGNETKTITFGRGEDMLTFVLHFTSADRADVETRKQAIRAAHDQLGTQWVATECARQLSSATSRAYRKTTRDGITATFDLAVRTCSDQFAGIAEKIAVSHIAPAAQKLRSYYSLAGYGAVLQGRLPSRPLAEGAETVVPLTATALAQATSVPAICAGPATASTNDTKDDDPFAVFFNSINIGGEFDGRFGDAIDAINSESTADGFVPPDPLTIEFLHLEPSATLVDLLILIGGADLSVEMFRNLREFSHSKIGRSIFPRNVAKNRIDWLFGAYEVTELREFRLVVNVCDYTLIARSVDHFHAILALMYAWTYHHGASE